MGLASLGGGALIGVTGGLAAPFIGAGIASLGLGSVVGGGAALLSTAAGVAIVGSLFGAAGAGLTGNILVDLVFCLLINKIAKVAFRYLRYKVTWPVELKVENTCIN